MSVIKCKMCGGDLQIIEGETVAECEYCGTKQTVPKVDDEKKLTLFSRANRLRLASEFDKAAGVYESIVADFPEEAEAYWGLVLCRYGIEYVDDPATGRKVPTCHRSSFDSILEDSDFEQACENADPIARRVYRDEAKTIEDIRKRIVEVSGKESPYDIFICYKETDEKGERTVDSVIAQDVYDALTEKGYRVFFSRITLEDKLGTEYEPYIFAALNSAKLMLAFGTDYEYFSAVWVKNEWSRYLQLMTKDKSKHLIPCFKGIDAYDMPKEFAHLQAQDMGKVGATQDLLRGVDKIMGKGAGAAPAPAATTAAVSTGVTVESLLKRAQMFLEDKDSKLAAQYAQKVLDIDPECADAYMVLLLATWGIETWEELDADIIKLVQSREYKRAKQFASGALADKLGDAERLADEHTERLEQEAKRRQEEAKRRQEEKARQKEEKLQRKEKMQKKLPVYYRCHAPSMVACGSKTTICLWEDGTVVACGNNDDGQCDVSDWKGIVAVAAGFCHTVGLKSDGTVVSCGKNNDGQCNVSDWKDIVAVTADGYHTVGLKSDGTVLAYGSNEYGQCNVSDWTNIVTVAAGRYHTVGLKSDGTVVACGWNKYGRCDVSEWKDIVAVAAGGHHTVGLKSDGTVVACGKNDDGRCNVSDWKGIVAVAVGLHHTVGLKSDGTVVACGYNEYGQCNVSEWEDIVAVAVGLWHTVELKSDGTVVACGYNKYGQCDVSNWKLFDNFDDVVNRAIAEKEKRDARLKAAAEKQRLDKIAALEKAVAEKEKRDAELKAASEKQRLDKIAALEMEKQQIETELPHVKGLFSGSKRRDMGNRLAEIEKELKKWRSN